MPKSAAAVAAALLSLLCALAHGQERLVEYVDPFIGTTNYGTTNPGARCPWGIMSVTPFNVMGSDSNTYDKDSRWWSTPYEWTNSFLTGFAHVNLSGVGCPDMSSLLLMATTGPLEPDYHKYGTAYSEERAEPGYYAVRLDRYGISAELTSTLRTSVSRFTFPAGESHLLLNLGEGLTNESGAFLRRKSETEIEGMKLLGNFCYDVPQAVYPIYFALRVSKVPKRTGWWKHQRPMTAEAEWDQHAGRYKVYTKYGREIAGDDIGAYFTYDTGEGESIEVRLAVSFVSTENAWQNMEAETAKLSFAQLRERASSSWEKELSRITVEGGTEEQRKVFYTALYHTMIQPSILQDINGQYPTMESDSVGQSAHDRYTIFSLWDTYRNVHQLMTLVYPERQLDMVRSMIDMYREGGWLPRWELMGRETLTMEGDPAIPVIVDTWLKGLKGYDIEIAYEAMLKSATLPSEANLLRSDNDDYLRLGYVPLRGKYDNSVSHALEYYVADHALSILADSLGQKEEARRFYKQSLGYKNYFDPATKTLRPKLPDGSFLSPYNPELGKNFEPNPGFHEGCAWNYAFFVPHDIPGLVRLHGGREAFVRHLQSVFDDGHYDPSNEPDIAYPYLFTYFSGEEWRTQQLVSELLAKHFRATPDGIPGNDDTGTMSAWAVFSMIGLYPDVPGVPEYALTAPTFDRITIRLDPTWYGSDRLIIEGAPRDAKSYVKGIRFNGKPLKRHRISHEILRQGGVLSFEY